MNAPCVTAVLWAVCASGVARAEIVHFINPAPGQPGHYGWHFGDLWSPQYLDITLAPDAQPNTAGANAVAQNRVAFDFGDIIDDAGIVSGHQAWGTPLAEVLVVPSLYTAALTYGHIVGAGAEVSWSDRSRHMSVLGLFSLTSQFPTGQRRYIGVRIQGDRLGWIEVSRDALSLTAHAWAYQTQPGVPITAGQVPAPGAAAVLALSSLTCVRRRRP